jgi:hypothetical protein
MTDTARDEARERVRAAEGTRRNVRPDVLHIDHSGRRDGQPNRPRCVRPETGEKDMIVDVYYPREDGIEVANIWRCHCTSSRREGPDGQEG